jgi:hypothetical protein
LACHPAETRDVRGVREEDGEVLQGGVDVAEVRLEGGEFGLGTAREGPLDASAVLAGEVEGRQATSEACGTCDSGSAAANRSSSSTVQHERVG